MRSPLKIRIIQSKPIQLIIRTFLKWQQDECWEMGAALAYYGIFSLFPLLLVILSIVGFLLGADTNVYNQLLSLAQNTLPPAAYNLVINTLRHLNRSSIGAGLVGFFLLLFTASNFFDALNRYVNKIWQVRSKQQSDNNLIKIALNFLKKKLSAFGIVLGISVLILLSLLTDIAILIILKIVNNLNRWNGLIKIDTLLLIRSLEVITISLLVIFVFTVLFKILPSTQVALGDVWLGALITTSLFMLLNYLVSNSIVQIGSQFLSYGVVGSVMILLLWIFLSCQIFLFGCEFTYAYAHLYGSRHHRKVPNTIV